MSDLTKKVAIVTGASKGIGFAIAKSLSLRGARVLIISRDYEKLRSSCESLVDLGAQADYLAGDISDPNLPNLAIDRISQKWGAPNILINNGGGPPMGGVLDFSDVDWQSSIDQNLLSAIRFSRLLIPIMKRNQWGRILSVSSTVAKEPSPNMVLSATLRAGLGAFTKSIATDLAPHGVTVNVLCPGGVLTDRLKDLVRARSQREGLSYDSLIEQSVSSIPSGRFADPDELGKVAAFLCSDDAAYITGVSLSVDGGLTKGFT